MDFPGKNTGVGCHFLLQEILSIQGSKLHLISLALASEFFTTSTTWEVWQTAHSLLKLQPRNDRYYFCLYFCFTQGWGNRLLEDTNKTLCTPRPRKKEQWPHKRLTQICSWVSKSLWQRSGLAVACCRVRGMECTSAWNLLKEIYLHYLHHSLASGQTTGREHSPANQQKIGLKIYWAWPPPIRTRPSFPLSQSKASISFFSFSIRGQTEWKPQSQKPNQSDHRDHSLV